MGDTAALKNSHKSVVAFLATGGLLAAPFIAVGAGSASAAPTGPSVDQTVRTLEASGYHVIVNKPGAEQLSACTVDAVRPGQIHSTTDGRDGNGPTTTVTSRTVFVDVAC